MNILIVNNTIIPVHLYGGTERVIWDLGKELNLLGHKVSYLVKKGSHCDFAKIIPINEEIDIIDQVPEHIDLVHFNYTPTNIKHFKKPYLITVHDNSGGVRPKDLNTVFVSKNHASRYGSKSYVYNGLDWNSYQKQNLKNKRDAFHFLGNAAWRVKNVKGAIDVIKGTPSQKLRVLGGVRFNLKMGPRFTFSRKVEFYGMVGGEKKDTLLNKSKGLVFPVRWHEPFGLAIIESLYFGCPVFGTPYGSLTELVPREVGFLSNKKQDLINAIDDADSYNKTRCHEYALDKFNSKQMAMSYLKKYEIVLNNNALNKVQPTLIEVQATKFLEWH